MKALNTKPVGYHYDKFPPKKLDWERLLPLIGPANRALAKFDGVLSVIPDAEILLTPLTTREAVLSSRIEGTQANLDEVLEYETERHRDSAYHCFKTEQYLNSVNPPQRTPPRTLRVQRTN